MKRGGVASAPRQPWYPPTAASLAPPLLMALRMSKRSDWIKLPGLFIGDELECGGVPIDPLFEYLILADSYDRSGQPLFAIYFRSRRSDRDPN